ncbi:VOC family protein [Nocardia takedensis]
MASQNGIGTLRSVVLDCPEPRKLAEFYGRLMGGDIVTDDPDWVVLADPSGQRFAFQIAPDYRPPEFPDTTGSQQFHLDVLVEDVDAAEKKVLAAGATLVQAETDGKFRVYRDPVGHTFCLVW